MDERADSGMAAHSAYKGGLDYKQVRERRMCVCVLGLARTIYIHSEHTVFLAGKSPIIRSYTVYIYMVLASSSL
jgi:hypothetical protein